MKRVILWSFLLLLIVAAIGVGALLWADQRARRADEVLVVELPFTVPGSGAVTTGRIIFIRSDRSDDADLLAHELVHVCQWEELGLEFLWDYTSEYVSNVVELRDLDDAYTELSFEREANLGEIDCNLDRYLVPES